MNKKKKIIIIAAVVLIIAAVAIGTKVGIDKSKPKVYTLQSFSSTNASKNVEHDVFLTAHRGFSGKAPENTLSAIKEAGNAKFYGCEFDIRLTSDNLWVVSHDNDVKRMTDGKGKISEMTLEKVKSHTIDSGSNVKDYPNEKIPTVEEMLDECKKSGINPVIEIKLEKGQAPDYKKLAKIITDKGFENCIVISFDLTALTELKKELPNATYRLLASEVNDETIESCKKNSIDGLDFNGNNEKNLEFIQKAKDAGLILSAWTIDYTETLDKLYDLGVYYFTTNAIYP